MKLKYWISASMSFLVLAVGMVQIADAQNRTVLNEAQRISGDQFTIATRTPNGARVYALKTPSAEMLGAIDRGLSDLFAVARKNRYRSRLNYRDYTIYIAKADRTKDTAGGYSPDIAVGSAQYSGTVYDKGGYIYAAGIVVALNPCAFMIAEHTKDFDRVANAVRYEGEHLVLYHNDRSLYASTADHSRGGGHPILQ
ncbi:MAG TPA: hypothetical protein PLP07_11380 [Pyrinomonadaceae bacterium]|nr:hypothetical protein [Chloracidobacterium sp.]MBP9936075.1 hypothetical protein [Pyrinomonadaceae bacterium]MBK7802184.1 hypothetical protein [Chloracidobacterium sp.]MBK9437668.1 hypothetical protein [Chloracidobacterium sp.]MBK9767843.1 hypothetical protein [Chloracidobacterium sp.]